MAAQRFGSTKPRVVANGELIANGAVAVVTACTAFAAGDRVIFTLKTLVGASDLPVITATVASTSFTTVNLAGTTSTYYYTVLRFA